MTTIVDLMGATVRVEQAIGDGQSVTGSAFIVAATADDGAPRRILITADHVLARMPHQEMRVGFRSWNPEQGWRYAPASIRIRSTVGEPLWTRHPTQDVSALELPVSVSSGGVPIAELPGAEALEKLRVKPGDDMMVLGYPQGVSANRAGFPILRSGKVASYPLSPASRYPSYLVDFDVFAGNSGGPVALAVTGPEGVATVVITGVLTQQIKYQDQRLSIGNVTQADFISETISLMDGVQPAEVLVPPAVADLGGSPAAAPAAEPSSAELAQATWQALARDVQRWIRRTWIITRDWWLAIWTPDAQRVDPRGL